MKIRRLLTAFVLFCVLRVTAAAQVPPLVAPETVGLSAERLKRMESVMRDYVDRGRIGGTVTVIQRDGKLVHHDAAGWLDVESKTAMRTDAI